MMEKDHDKNATETLLPESETAGMPEEEVKRDERNQEEPEEALPSYVSEEEAIRAEKARKLQEEFNYEDYQVVRKELFAHQRDPAVTISWESIAFNTACINGFEEVVYINLYINPEKRKLAIRKRSENDKDALRWCVEKPDKRKSRKVTSREFSKRIFALMKWDKTIRYKIMGYKIEYRGEALYLFDLNDREVLSARKRKKPQAGDASVGLCENENAASGEQINRMPAAEAPVYNDGDHPFSPEDWRNTFGIPVVEHDKALEIDNMDEYVGVEVNSNPQQGYKDEGKKEQATENCGNAGETDSTCSSETVYSDAVSESEQRTLNTGLATTMTDRKW